MGACQSIPTNQPAPTNISNYIIPMKPTAPPEIITKYWRYYDYHEGYNCSICGSIAICYDNIQLNCSPHEQIIINNEWHYHCQHNILVNVICQYQHVSQKILNTRCECGWSNSQDVKTAWL